MAKGRLIAIVFFFLGHRGAKHRSAVAPGITAADDTLPARMTDEPIDPADPASVVPLAPMKRRYHAHRG